MISKHKCLLVSFAILLLLTMQQLFAQHSEYNLNQLIDSALEHNYLLKANDKNVFIKQTEIEQLRTNYQPRLAASASFSYWKFLLPNKQRLLGNALTDMYTDITAYQTIYDWGDTKKKKEFAQAEIKLNDDVRRQIRNTIVYGVSTTYLDVMMAAYQIEVLQNSIRQIESQKQHTRNLYQIGKVSNIDVLKTEVQLSVEQKKLQTAHNDYAYQLTKLKNLCYLTVEELPMIENNSNKLFEKYSTESYDLKALSGLVLENHAAITGMNKKIELEQKQRDLYANENRPELYSYGIASWEHGYIPFGKNFNYNIGVGIRYTLPYFGGSGFKSKMKKSDFKIEQLNDEKQQIYLDFKREIDLTLNQISEVKDEIINNEKIIALSTETLNNATVKYQAGQGTILDVLDAQSILTDTNLALQKAKISLLQKILHLHYLSGNDAYPFAQNQ